jgi:outer membrane protein OmpA-like peptidoglycan-associated protein
MRSDREDVPESCNVSRFARAAGVLTAIMLVSGCSAVPDWANPVEWYDGVVGSDSAETETESKAVEAKKTPGDGKEFPNLASVPERPKAPSEDERKRLADSLNADRENAKYSDEVIRRQGASAVPPPPPAPTRTAAAPAASRAPSAPAIPAAPSAPVARAAVPPLPGATAAAPRPVPSAPSAASSAAGASALAPGSILTREPVSRPPKFNTAPPSPSAPAARASAAEPRYVRPNVNVQSVARVGNPTFGAPPADIAAALGAGAAPSARFSPPPRVPGTFSNGVANAAGAPAATVRFKAGSAQLTRAGRRQIQQIAGMFRQRGGAVRVEGHASSRTRNMDPVQHHLVNFNVSLNRANVVAGELVRQGVPAQSVFVAAMSDSQPLFYEVMPAGDAGNQRVEIHFVN